MNQLISTVKTNYKTILYVIGSILFLYLFIFLLTRKPQIPADIKATIDSLTNVNKQLVEKQNQINNTIDSINNNVDEVDFKINNIKEKTTIVREYYHEINQQANKYTPTQIDSFFKARYSY